MSVRKIRPSGRSLTGRVARPTHKTSADFESSLERDLYKLLVFDKPRIARFEEQPLRIPYTDPLGYSRSYTPDVLIHFNADPVTGHQPPPMLAEVKYRKNLFEQWKELKPKFKAARAFCREQGWQPFRIFTENEIRTPYLWNVNFLLGYERTELIPEEVKLLLDTLAALRTATPQTLLLACSTDLMRGAELMPVLWRLIALKQIGCNLDERLTMVSPIWTLGLRTLI
jgi:hypothetical protein